MSKLVIALLVMAIVAGVKVWDWYRSPERHKKQDRKDKDRAHEFNQKKLGPRSSGTARTGGKGLLSVPPLSMRGSLDAVRWCSWMAMASTSRHIFLLW